jgi:hypothetical protein
LFLVLVHVLVLVLEIPAREDWVTAFFLRVVGPPESVNVELFAIKAWFHFKS